MSIFLLPSLDEKLSKEVVRMVNRKNEVLFSWVIKKLHFLHSLQISTADESLNTIIHNEDVRSSGEDEATRIDLEIPQFKDDILIFLKSKAESNKLSRILQSRNMTLEELIEHRERGSSQLHLAEIFKSSPKAIPEADFDLSPPQPPVTEEPPMLGSFPNSISQEVRTTSWVWYLLMGICFTIPFLPTTDVLTSTFERWYIAQKFKWEK